MLTQNPTSRVPTAVRTTQRGTSGVVADRRPPMGFFFIYAYARVLFFYRIFFIFFFVYRFFFFQCFYPFLLASDETRYT